MRRNEPPRLATWLLKRFGGHRNNDALIGDLVERYRGGESVAWYWAQVATAIAGSSVRNQSGKVAGLAVGLLTACASIAWNMTFNSRNGMGHHNIYSLVVVTLTVCAVFYWSRYEQDVLQVAYRLRSMAWIGALVFSTSLFAFSQWWFDPELTRRADVQRSFTKFAVIDFVIMLVVVLVLGYIANRMFHLKKLNRSSDASS